MSSDEGFHKHLVGNEDFLKRLANHEVRILCHRGGPSITKYGRLRNVHKEHYSEFFEINGYGGINNIPIIDITYLSDIKCGSRKYLYKSGTEKMGGFFNIKDICEKLFGPEPDDGWRYDLIEIYRDDQSHSTKYMVLE